MRTTGITPPEIYRCAKPFRLPMAVSQQIRSRLPLALTNGGPATILLTQGQLEIRSTLTLNGPGANLLTIDASGSDPTPLVDNSDGSRVFRVQNFGYHYSTSGSSA